MSVGINRPNLEEILGQILRRLAKLETGARPLAGNSNPATASFTINAGVTQGDIEVTLGWVDPDITANPKGDPMFDIFVDTDNNQNFRYPNGASLSAGQKKMDLEYHRNLSFNTANPGKNKINVKIVNNDSGSHTYYLHVSWILLRAAGGSG